MKPAVDPRTALLGASERFAAADLDMRVTANGKLTANGAPFFFKGASWLGTEGSAMVPHGLGRHSVDHYLAFLQAEGFNAIRLPFDHERALKNQIVPMSDDLAFAPELANLPYSHVFLTIARAAARRHMVVVLACDRLSPAAAAGRAGSGRWFNNDVSEELSMRSWQRLSKVLCGEWNVVGVDLLAQPFKATWGFGDVTNDWNLAAERIGNHVLGVCRRWLVFVQGVGEQPGAGSDQELAGGMFWGENLWGARRHPLQLSDMTKLVYAPVTYGPSTYGKFPFFLDRKFPRNMNGVWEQKFGFVHSELGAAMVFAQLGDRFDTAKSKAWLEWAMSYVADAAGCAGFFMSSLTPDADTGGLLLADFSAPLKPKLDVLSRAPTTPLLAVLPPLSPRAPPSPPPPHSPPPPSPSRPTPSPPPCPVTPPSPPPLPIAPPLPNVPPAPPPPGWGCITGRVPVSRMAGCNSIKSREECERAYHLPQPEPVYTRDYHGQVLPQLCGWQGAGPGTPWLISTCEAILKSCERPQATALGVHPPVHGSELGTDKAPSLHAETRTIDAYVSHPSAGTTATTVGSKTAGAVAPAGGQAATGRGNSPVPVLTFGVDETSPEMDEANRVPSASSTARDINADFSESSYDSDEDQAHALADAVDETEDDADVSDYADDEGESLGDARSGNEEDTPQAAQTHPMQQNTVSVDEHVGALIAASTHLKSDLQAALEGHSVMARTVSAAGLTLLVVLLLVACRRMRRSRYTSLPVTRGNRSHIVDEADEEDADAASSDDEELQVAMRMRKMKVSSRAERKR